MKARLTPGMAVLGLAVLVLTGCAGSAAAPNAPTAALTAAGFHGTEPDNVPARPSFFLTDDEGKSYDFFAQTRGHPTLLFFGYTDCPDECPTAMAYIAAALRTSEAAIREQTRVVFVTTDPARDSAARLKQWLGAYGDVVGLRGTLAQVQQAQRLVGAPVARDSGPVATLPGDPTAHVHQAGTPPHTHDRPLGTGIAHDTSIFAYDASDRLPVIYPASVSPADIRADLPALARKE